MDIEPFLQIERSCFQCDQFSISGENWVLLVGKIKNMNHIETFFTFSVFSMNRAGTRIIFQTFIIFLNRVKQMSWVGGFFLSSFSPPILRVLRHSFRKRPAERSKKIIHLKHPSVTHTLISDFSWRSHFPYYSKHSFFLI